ncbi:MAG: preprotein translocase subunit SecY [Candidatus Moranbacteria bacterium RIFCSPLOWO2_02_FULL_48_19]|nr:MAG: preprotein translocase subunit SecY [Candidatus Moranbacteria bacterium RIFCSPLOWO2_02_FULL_48_19]OGI30001.1 MAG: preprotein translocase subunit SecY [Candidatus Moranbacteria bacterium RIFCSPLOWO2_12_FULL_48_12]
MRETFLNIFRIAELRNKIFFILGLLVVYRIAANIPLPGVDVLALKRLFEDNAFLGLLNVFSGGGLSNISIVLLGVAPYITASIIMQLLTTIVPSLERLYKEEGEIGRQKFNMWTRWITVPLAALQSFSMLSLLRSQNILGDITPFNMAVIIVSATAGTVFLMWLGELITEKGLGNGVSMIIFAGIVSSLPTGVSRFVATWDPSQVFTYILFALVAAVTIAGVIFVNEGQRTVPVAYAKRVRGAQVYGGAATHLPLRVNQAGVIPIIFAVSLILIPTMVANFLAQSGNARIADIALSASAWLQNQWVYGGLYFVLVVVFTYFYTAVVFDPVKIAENLQKQGGYIPGIRPGHTTAGYLYHIINRITLAGAFFLGAIAVLPFIVQGATGIQSFSIGGISILIVVSVVLETIKHVQSQLTMRSYESF